MKDRTAVKAPEGTAAYLYAYLSNETGGTSEVHFDDMRIEHERLVPDNSRAGRTYRFAFNGKERDIRDFGKTTNYDYGFRIYSPAVAKFLSVDPLTKSYPYLTPYQFASNRPIDGIDLDGLEYLRADESVIEMRGGEVHLKVENLSYHGKRAWIMRDYNARVDGRTIPGCVTGCLGGYPTRLNEITHPDLPMTNDEMFATGLDHTYGAPDPNYVMGQHNIGKPTAKSTGLPDRRYKDRTVSGLSPKGGRAPGLALVLNAVLMADEQWEIFSMSNDRKLLGEHSSILIKNVMTDIDDALSGGLIPKRYQNVESIGNIANVVLTGINRTDDPGIYEVGMNIVKEISGNYHGSMDVIQSNNNSDNEGALGLKEQRFIIPGVKNRKTEHLNLKNE